MSRDPNRSSAGDLGRERWDRERFDFERGRYNDYREDYRDSYPREDRGYTRNPPPPRGYGEDEYVRDSRLRWADDAPRRRPSSPPTEEFDRKVTIARERVRSPSPVTRLTRPGPMIRRQSSLDTFDRRPARYYEREDYDRIARRDDLGPPAGVPIPLPRTRQVPPPRRYEREYDEIRVSDPDYYGDDNFRPRPERVREREIIRTRRRDRSRDSHTTHTRTVRSSSRSSSTSSRTSRTSDTTTVKSEYPKKGKTRIPARLVSKRAIMDLGYPFIEEGHTIVIQRALGQENIDDLLKLSENYKKSEVEMSGARLTPAPLPPPGPPAEHIEERREEIILAPSGPPPGPNMVEVNRTTLVRDISPSRSSTTTTTSYGPTVVEVHPRGREQELQLVHHHHHHGHSRHRSHSHGAHHYAETLPNGELVLYEERVERIEEPRRGVRIEKDKKGPPPGLVRAMLATLT